MSEIVHEYTITTQGLTSSEHGLWIRTAILTSNLVISLFELTLYIILYIDLTLHDRSMTNAIGRDTVQQRHQRNVISLSGQIVCFFLEIFMTIAAVIILNQAYFQRTMNPALMSFFFGLRALGELLASPELKRHLKIKIGT